MRRPLFSLLVTLIATLTFAAFAGSETRFAVYADDGRLVGVGEIELEYDEREAEVDLLRGFEGFVRVVVERPDGSFVAYDGLLGPTGLTVVVDGAFLDLRAFVRLFGDGLAAALSGDADLMVLDLNLPDVDGVEVARRLQADGDLRLDLATRQVMRGDASARLPELEFEVLRVLVAHPGRVFSRDDLERRLYGAAPPASNNIEVFVSHLRRRLRALGAGDPIRTVRSEGYTVL